MDTSKFDIIGDSYLYSFFSMDPRYFEKTGAVQFVRWSTPKAIPYQLATDKKNILLLKVILYQKYHYKNKVFLPNFDLNLIKLELDHYFWHELKNVP